MTDRQPTLRAVLLGASNLRTALAAVLDGVRRKAAGPVDALVACGHGRSYGTWSRYLFVRGLPGIVQCGLWPTLAALPPIRTLALITDVGNDLVYGASVPAIAGWVEACLDRLVRHQAEIVMSLLPLARLERLSPRGVRLAVAILFPGRPAPWPGLLARARELDERLRILGGERGVQLLEPAGDWYGIDPIHPRRSRRQAMWGEILSRWPAETRGPERPLRSRFRTPVLGAEQVRLLGRTRRTRQPVVRLADRTTVSLY